MASKISYPEAGRGTSRKQGIPTVIKVCEGGCEKKERQTVLSESGPVYLTSRRKVCACLVTFS